MKKLAIVLLTLCMLSSTALAHGGRTDGSGGHKDNKNASGLGGYHYHHGQSAHLHPNGVCPYEAKPKATSKPVATSKPAATPKASPSATEQKILDAQAKLNELGYKCGTPDGKIGKNTKAAIKSFQKDNDLKVTGALNDATYKLIMGK